MEEAILGEIPTKEETLEEGEIPETPEEGEILEGIQEGKIGEAIASLATQRLRWRSIQSGRVHNQMENLLWPE